MIVDASVTVKWLVEEELTPKARDLVTRHDLTAPDVIDIEIAAVLTRKMRQRVLSAEHARELRVGHARMPIQRMDWRGFETKAFDLSLRLRAGFADCIYLALAILNDDVVVTADEHFARAVAVDPSCALHVKTLREL